MVHAPPVLSASELERVLRALPGWSVIEQLPSAAQYAPLDAMHGLGAQLVAAPRYVPAHPPPGSSTRLHPPSVAQQAPSGIGQGLGLHEVASPW